MTGLPESESLGMPRQYGTTTVSTLLTRDLRVEAPGGGIPLTSALPRGIAILFPRQALPSIPPRLPFFSPMGRAQIFPLARKLISRPAPTMMWSCRVRPSVLQPFWISFVIFKSASEGSGSALG